MEETADATERESPPRGQGGRPMVRVAAALGLPSLVPRPSPLSAHYTRASCAHADSYARGRPGLKHHVRYIDVG